MAHTASSEVFATCPRQLVSGFLQDQLQPEEGVCDQVRDPQATGLAGMREVVKAEGRLVAERTATPSLWILALEPPAKRMKGLSHPKLLHILSFHCPLDPTTCSLCLHPRKKQKGGEPKTKFESSRKVLGLWDL